MSKPSTAWFSVPLDAVKGKSYVSNCEVVIDVTTITSSLREIETQCATCSGNVLGEFSSSEGDGDWIDYKNCAAFVMRMLFENSES